MPSSHDLKQDQHLADLDAEVANLRQKINANVRKMKQISDKLNARLAAPAHQASQPPKAPRAARTRRKTPGKGVKVR